MSHLRRFERPLQAHQFVFLGVAEIDGRKVNLDPDHGWPVRLCRLSGQAGIHVVKVVHQVHQVGGGSDGTDMYKSIEAGPRGTHDVSDEPADPDKAGGTGIDPCGRASAHTVAVDVVQVERESVGAVDVEVDKAGSNELALGGNHATGGIGRDIPR